MEIISNLILKSSLSESAMSACACGYAWVRVYHLCDNLHLTDESNVCAAECCAR